MKKLIILFSLVVFWNLAFSATIQRSISIYGLFPAEQLSLLQTVTKDTLIFSKMDTVYKHEWKRGIFYPTQYMAPYVVDIYHRVVNDFGNNILAVYVNGYESEPKQIGPYVQDYSFFGWPIFCLLLVIHCYIFYVLRKHLFWIHSDNRYAKIRRQRKETIISVVATVLLTSAILGWLIGSYFFTFFPAVNLIMIFLPARTWYSGLTRMETSKD